MVNLLIKSLETLFFSWGGDTPEEVYWGANELLAWLEEEKRIKFNIRFEEGNFEEVKNTLERML